MKITVRKINEPKERMPLMKDVPFGHLVKTKSGIHAITEGGGAYLLIHSDKGNEPWFGKAHGVLMERVEVIGKIKGITFDIE